MTVSRIEWETDGEAVSLPTEVEVPDGLDDDGIAEYLSDTYGWLVRGFAVPLDETKDVDAFGLYVNEVEGRVS